MEGVFFKLEEWGQKSFGVCVTRRESGTFFIAKVKFGSLGNMKVEQPKK